MKKRLLFLVLIVLLLTGCGKKSITVSEFKAGLKGDFEITEATTYEGMGDIKFKKALKATNDECVIYYYRFSSEEKAIKVFEDFQDKVGKFNPYGKTKKHYERATAFYDGEDDIVKDGYGKGVNRVDGTKNIKLLSRIQDTIVYAEANNVNWEKADNREGQMQGYLSVIGYWD